MATQTKWPFQSIKDAWHGGGNHLRSIKALFPQLRTQTLMTWMVSTHLSPKNVPVKRSSEVVRCHGLRVDFKHRIALGQVCCVLLEGTAQPNNVVPDMRHDDAPQLIIPAGVTSWARLVLNTREMLSSAILKEEGVSMH